MEMQNTGDAELLRIFVPRIENILEGKQMQWDIIKISLSFSGGGFHPMMFVYFGGEQQFLSYDTYWLTREEVVFLLTKHSEKKRNQVIITINKVPKEYQVLWKDDETTKFYQKRIDSMKKGNSK